MRPRPWHHCPPPAEPGFWSTGFWDIASFVGNILAAAIAVVAIVIALRQGKAAHQALVRERRIDFQLDVLSDIAEVFGAPPSNPQLNLLKARVRMLPATLLPRLADAISNETADGNREAMIYTDGPTYNPKDHYHAHLFDEVLAAIASLLEQRDMPTAKQGSAQP